MGPRGPDTAALAGEVARRERLPRWTTRYDDAEAAYHRNLTNRINALHGEALHAWQERIVAYVGSRDEQTGELAKYLDGMQRTGVDAQRMLELAVARKQLPVDHPTAALAYRVTDLVARRARRAALVGDFRRTTPSSSGRALGLCCPDLCLECIPLRDTLQV